MEKLKRFLLNNTWLLIIIFSIPAIWSLLVPGFWGVSDDMHVAWLHQMDKVVKMGKFPPRFVPDLSYGFGYPLFNFVFPLPFYVGETFHLLGLTLVGSLKLVFLVGILLSMFFMFRLLRKYSGVWLSLAGSVLYVYTPYRATDIYVRGAVGESLAFVFLPLIVLSILEVGRSKRWIGIGSLGIGGLILSHNITALMFIPLVLALSFLLFAFSQRKIKIALHLFLIFLLGLLISIYFWLPAILESNLMKYDTVFNYLDHFPTIKQLITPYFGYGASVPGPGDGMSFYLGTVNIFLIIFGIIASGLFWSKFSLKQKIFLIWNGVVFLIAFFMMNYRSTFIWQNIPFIKYFQFPWRFLTLTTFTSSIFVVALNKIKWTGLIAAGLIFFSIILNASSFRPQRFLFRDDGYYINRYIPTPEASDEYKKTSEEYLRLPKDTQVRPEKNYPIISVEQASLENIRYLNDLDAEFYVVSDNRTLVDYNKYYLPGWKAWIDGQEANLKNGYPFGQINIEVPEGKHKVEVKYLETDFRKVFDWISAISFITCIFLISKSGTRKIL